MNDLKLAVRRLTKNRAISVVALLTMALCIGANVTIFAIVDAILVRSLPFPEPDRLALVYNGYPGAGTDRSDASIPNYFDRREGVQAFESVSLHQETSSTVGAPGSVQRVVSARVTPEFLETLKQPLALGQMFSEDDMRYGSNRVTIITDAFWRRHFNSDPAILGRTFLLNSAPATVIGVLPPRFRYLDSKAQVYRPLTHSPEERELDQRHNNVAQMVVRLAHDVTFPEAQAQMDAFNAQQLVDEPLAKLLTQSGYHSSVVSLHGDHVRGVKPFLILLQVGVFFLLVIGAMNLTNLLLIRASGRIHEVAVRQALGATHSHEARWVFTETILLGVLGGMLGILVATAGLHLVRLLGTDRLPLGTAITFDLRLILIALLGSVLLGICLSLPVIGFNRFFGGLATHLQSESRSGTSSNRIQRLRSGFSVVQVALAFVILAGAGLLGVSLNRLLDTSPGFESERVLAGHLSLPWNNYQEAESRVQFVDRLVAALQGVPGVTHAAVSNTLPFTQEATDSDNGVSVEGFEPAVEGTLRTHYLTSVSPDYCKAMGIPLRQGRHLRVSDRDPKTRVAVVDAAFADYYWPEGDAVGRRYSNAAKFDPDDFVTVVGVVGSVKQTDLAETSGHGVAYTPFAQFPTSTFRVLLRTEMSPEKLGPLVRQVILDLDPELPIGDLRTMQTHIDESLMMRRSPAVLVSIFAAIALLLAAIGIYGVLAYTVGQRRREIGVRMAVGALPRQIRQQFMGIGLRILICGTVLGLLGIWFARRAMESVLFDMGTAHWPTLLGTLALISVVTIVACLLPAERAARIPPTEALR